MRIAVTTSRVLYEGLTEQARSIAEELSIPYVPRNDLSLKELSNNNKLDYLLVVEKNQVIVKGPAENFKWHPNLAMTRLKSLHSGQTDHMIEAMGLQEGFQVLDCTLGLGADALVVAYGVGATGHVTGLESSPVIAFITRWGLQNYQGENKNIKTLTERITVINCLYQDYLQSLPDNSYDVVYFDPMFRQAIDKSSGIKGLRTWANSEPLSKEALAEACRVARSRVVFKERSNSPEFARLGAQKIVGGKYSPLAYGIWFASAAK